MTDNYLALDASGIQIWYQHVFNAFNILLQSELVFF